MTQADLNLLKSALARLSELIKYSTGGDQGVEPSHPLAATTDSSTIPFSTESKLPIGGPKQPKKRSKNYPYPDYSYGQRGKKEAGKTKPGVTALPSEPTATRLPPTEYGTPYTEDNL